MRILFFDWLLISLIVFGFYYFVDKVHKRESIKWTSRFAWCGALSAVLLAFIVFLERL